MTPRQQENQTRKKHCRIGEDLLSPFTASQLCLICSFEARPENAKSTQSLLSTKLFVVVIFASLHIFISVQFPFMRSGVSLAMCPPSLHFAQKSHIWRATPMIIPDQITPRPRPQKIGRKETTNCEYLVFKLLPFSLTPVSQ